MLTSHGLLRVYYFSYWESKRYLELVNYGGCHDNFLPFAFKILYRSAKLPEPDFTIGIIQILPFSETV